MQQRVSAQAGYIELHCQSAFSFLRAGSSVEALVARAAALGMPALALTDHMTLAGAVRFQAACAEHGVRPILGVELAVADPMFGDAAAPAHLVALAENATGYARLCQLLTDANLADPDAPLVPFSALAAAPEGLILLTGGVMGSLVRLLLADRSRQAVEVARRYAETFGPERVYVELQHHRLPESVGLMRRLAAVAEEAGLRCVATNGVRHATRDEYPLYDLLTCVRLGIAVDQPHAERPRNDEACLKGAAELAALVAPLPWGADALAASVALAARCDLSLLKGVCTAPRVAIPAGETTSTHLRRLCEAGLERRLRAPATTTAASQGTVGAAYRRQLEHELAVVQRLDLEEFFLCVHDIIAAAREMGIRCSGRGSAANSLVAYCLGITGVDPLAHGLLFERFLNPERCGMPDIDVDVQSDRRDELIRYVERTYTERHAAMVANVITYRTRSALRDAAKALGYPLPLVNRMTKILPHHAARGELPRYREELAGVIAAIPLDAATRERCLARLPLLLDIAPRLCGLPRHLSLHNGGMVLTREPLADLLPVRVSANGVRALEVDKDDVERLGLIKFDLLGLRTLGAVEEALTLIEETTGDRPDLDALPTVPPDPATMRLIRAGQTLAVFQIESPGQWHLLAQTQPETFDDLIVQTALFRPGPLQADMVHPYVERRQQKQQVAAPRPSHRSAGVSPASGTGRRDAGAPTTSSPRPSREVPWLGSECPPAGPFPSQREGGRGLGTQSSPERLSPSLPASPLRSPAAPLPDGRYLRRGCPPCEGERGASASPRSDARSSALSACCESSPVVPFPSPGAYQGGRPGDARRRRQAQVGRREGGRGLGPRDAVQTTWHGRPADTFWTAHPVLGPILGDTEGILLFQEQILEIAHQFAGLSYADADGFRRAMSHYRTPDEMEAMRSRFVTSAVSRGERVEDATRVFDAISNFVGYGFCKSHAAEFARTIYQTAWLKAHYPAHYLAAFLSSQPAGFFPPHVVLEEARLLGIPLLSVDVNRSEDRFSVARVGTDGRWALRIGLRQVAQVGEELARAILWERRGGCPGEVERRFTSIADFCRRMRPAGLTWSAAEALVLVGAFESLAPRVERRRQLWRLHELWPLVSSARARGRGRVASSDGNGNGDGAATPEQLILEWEVAAETAETAETTSGPAALPPLPALGREERLALDYQLLGLSARPHPMRLIRRDLRRQGVRSIAELGEVAEGQIVRVAGWTISAQRPPTAKGMGFMVLEDETGRLPVALPPKLAAEMHRRIRDTRAVVVAGRVERVRWYRSLLAFDLTSAAPLSPANE